MNDMIKKGWEESNLASKIVIMIICAGAVGFCGFTFRGSIIAHELHAKEPVAAKERYDNREDIKVAYETIAELSGDVKVVRMILEKIEGQADCIDCSLNEKNFFSKR